MATRSDHFISPDYYALDELFTEEQRLVRESVRNYVKREISPIIEEYAQRAEFPNKLYNNWENWVVLGPLFLLNMAEVASIM